MDTAASRHNAAPWARMLLVALLGIVAWHSALAAGLPPGEAIHEGETILVPVRALADAFGYQLGIDTGAVTVTGGAQPVTVGAGNQAMTRGTVAMPLPVAPAIVGDRLYVPARAVGEALGLDVRWHPGSDEDGESVEFRTTDAKSLMCHVQWRLTRKRADVDGDGVDEQLCLLGYWFAANPLSPPLTLPLLPPNQPVAEAWLLRGGKRIWQWTCPIDTFNTFPNSWWFVKAAALFDVTGDGKADLVLTVEADGDLGARFVLYGFGWRGGAFRPLWGQKDPVMWGTRDTMFLLPGGPRTPAALIHADMRGQWKHPHGTDPWDVERYELHGGALKLTHTRHKAVPTSDNPLATGRWHSALDIPRAAFPADALGDPSTLER